MTFSFYTKSCLFEHGLWWSVYSSGWKSVWGVVTPHSQNLLLNNKRSKVYKQNNPPPQNPAQVSCLSLSRKTKQKSRKRDVFLGRKPQKMKYSAMTRWEEQLLAVCAPISPPAQSHCTATSGSAGRPLYVHIHYLARRAQFKCSLLNYLQKTVGQPIVLCWRSQRSLWCARLIHREIWYST